MVRGPHHNPTGPLASIAALLATLAGLSAASAQPAPRPPSVDLRGFWAPTDPMSGTWYEPANSPSTLDVNFGSWMHYAWGAVGVRSGGAVVARPLEHQLSRNLTANLGLFSRVAIGIDLPYVLYQSGDVSPALPDVKLPAQAFGDLAIVAKVTLLPSTSGPLGGLAIALHERFTVPTGDEASFLGEGDVASETRLLVEYKYRWIAGYAAAGAKLRGAPASLGCAVTDASCKTRFGHEVPFGLAFSLKPALFGVDKRERATLFVEAHGYVPFDPIPMFESAAASQLQLGGGARYALRDVSFLAAVEGALLPGVGNAAFRGTLSIGWAPRSHDRDGDDVDDEVDLCINLPEDKDGFQDQDGCPDLDNDQDGIPDTADKCPNQPEDKDGFEDDDGCPDPDDDRDGILDEDDACKNEKGPPHADKKKNGCPDKDPDGDGVLGAADQCPKAPEDKDGFQDDDGCPDPDNDKDGILDVDDFCPLVPGIDAPLREDRGCPDKDPDRDTLLEGEDECPNEPEDWNGVDDGDGCPDDPKKAKGKAPLAKVAGGKIEVSGAVLFVTKVPGGGPALDPKSLPTLRAIASLLRGSPELTLRVAVRPIRKDDDSAAKNKLLAARIDLLARRKATEIVAWEDVKAEKGAAGRGIGFALRSAGP